MQRPVRRSSQPARGRDARQGRGGRRRCRHPGRDRRVMLGSRDRGVLARSRASPGRRSLAEHEVTAIAVVGRTRRLLRRGKRLLHAARRTIRGGLGGGGQIEVATAARQDLARGVAVVGEVPRQRRQRQGRQAEREDRQPGPLRRPLRRLAPSRSHRRIVAHRRGFSVPSTRAPARRRPAAGRSPRGPRSRAIPPLPGSAPRRSPGCSRARAARRAGAQHDAHARAEVNGVTCSPKV